MAPLFYGSRIPTEADERLRMAAAVAAEEVLDLHVASALELVERGADRVPVERLLDAYLRLHSLDLGQEWRIRERVVAALGQEIGADGTAPRLTATPSVLRRLVLRLRGRVHHDLREWVEVHAARVELSLVDAHVRHALAFVRILAEHRTTSEAIRHYTRTMSLPATTAEFVRLKAVLATAGPAAPTSAEPHHGSPPRLPLRLADGGS